MTSAAWVVRSPSPRPTRDIRCIPCDNNFTELDIGQSQNRGAGIRFVDGAIPCLIQAPLHRARYSMRSANAFRTTKAPTRAEISPVRRVGHDSADHVAVIGSRAGEIRGEGQLRHDSRLKRDMACLRPVAEIGLSALNAWSRVCPTWASFRNSLWSANTANGGLPIKAARCRHSWRRAAPL